MVAEAVTSQTNCRSKPAKQCVVAPDVKRGSFFLGGTVNIDKRTRLGRIYEAGAKVYREMTTDAAQTGHAPSEPEMTLLPLAAMIAEATKTPERAKTGKKAGLHPMTTEFYDWLCAAGPRIVTEPYNKTWKAKLSAQLKKLPDVTAEDATKVGRFIEAKGWWQDRDPTMARVIHHLPELIASARRGLEKAEEHSPFHG